MRWTGRARARWRHAASGARVEGGVEPLGAAGGWGEGGGGQGTGGRAASAGEAHGAGRTNASAPPAVQLQGRGSG